MRSAVVILLGAICLSLDFGELSRVASSRAGDAPTTAPATTAPTTSTTNGFAPIAYYEEYCSRCHGPFGSGYLPDMGKRLNDDALRKVIREMAEGPAGLPIDDAAIEAQLAYHRSMLDGAPFIARASPTELSGEVTAGSTVSIVVDGKTMPAVVEGHAWKADGARTTNARVVAERDGKTTTLEAGKLHSHATPRAGQ